MTVPLLPQLAPEAFDMPDADKLAIATVCLQSGAVAFLFRPGKETAL